MAVPGQRGGPAVQVDSESGLRDLQPCTHAVGTHRRSSGVAEQRRSGPAHCGGHLHLVGCI